MNERIIYSTIGSRIRESRESLHMTQDELGALVGLTRTSITNIERGIQKLGIDTLYDIAAVFGISVADLLPDTHPDSAIAETYRQIAELKRQEMEIQRKLKALLKGNEDNS